MFKKICFISCLLCSVSMWAQSAFETNFYPKTMRVDYFRCGDATKESVYIDEVREEPYWGGSKVNLIDTTGYGNYFVKVYDKQTNALIYSRGYCNLFGEWQTIPEAKQTQKCYTESVVFPYPKKDIKVVFESRNKKGKFEKTFEYDIDVNSYLIKKEANRNKVFDVVYSGAPENCVDIVVLSEGYTADQYDLFKEDAKKFADAIFSFSPFKENKGRFNVKAVWTPSTEEGSDIPGEHIWKETALNSTFYTFDSERYIMTPDFKSVRDAASSVPYDFIYIIANSKKYGGGGIYNYYGLSVAGNEGSYEKIYVHEFGHLFLGLGDEYQGDASYNDFYPKGVEPWEANLTRLIGFDKKWKNMLPEGTKIPTTDENAEIGVFEGGGYVNEGIYRPRKNCLMRSFSINDFCPVCTKAILGQIDFYTK
ncbi:MAG: M64 family metallopeptidase [Tannerellaceae bacterium]